jgi:putative transposase
MSKGLHYTMKSDKSYLLTMTVVDWIDLFTRLNHKMLLVDSLKYCQENKGLNIFGWCLMPSHLHLIANTAMGKELKDVVRDFKRFTCNNLIEQIINEPESIRKWLIRQQWKINSFIPCKCERRYHQIEFGI